MPVAADRRRPGRQARTDERPAPEGTRPSSARAVAHGDVGGGGRRRARPPAGEPGPRAVQQSFAEPGLSARGRDRGRPASGFGSFFSTTSVSVVSTIDAIEAALRSAERVTLTGSMTPAAMQVAVLAGRRR